MSSDADADLGMRRSGSGQRAESRSEPSLESLERAAQWYAALHDENTSDADRAGWQAWMAQAPENATAWACIESISRKFDPLRGTGPRAAAAAIAGTHAARRPRISRRQSLRTLAVIAGGGLASGLSWRHADVREWVAVRGADERTAVGERRNMVLSDGTDMWLNTDTAVKLEFDSSERRLVLLRGEIQIHTAQDRLGRPFFVQVDAGTMQPLGTRFNVRRENALTRLDVFEGTVEVRTRAGQRQQVAARRAALFDAESVAPLTSSDPMREGWSRGVLPANDVPLRELLEELGHYRHGYISVAPSVADLKVMGIFPISDPDRALAMLEQTLPIRVRRVVPFWTTVEAK